MKLPNADDAVIAQDKVRDYLLNVSHRRGGSKARLLISLGYKLDDWHRLAADVRQYHLSADVAIVRETEYGVRYEISAPILTPAGKTRPFRSIWQIDTGSTQARLITMYPE